MEKYEELKMEVIAFDSEDIVTESNTGGDDDTEWT